MLTRTDSSSSHLASVLCVATHCKHSCFQVANKSLLLDTNLFSFTALHHGKKLVNVTGDATFQIPLVSQLLYLKSLIADFFAFLVPDNLGLWISCGLAHKGRDSPLDACLVLWGSCESRGCCMKKNINQTSGSHWACYSVWMHIHMPQSKTISCDIQLQSW